MAKYLYIFCYQTPKQLAATTEQEEKEEASEAVFIEASSAEEALAWGCEISEEFVHRLFPGQNVSWKALGFAHWVEPEPQKEYPADLLAGLPTVATGSHPVLGGFEQ